ncbi:MULTISPECIES: type II toxin-antitoxin system Phd/YefM family antitoxin [unclassified Actinomyces]|uniref:type II toxin-antitoxin system Phd/YefM family antitoxin n=1 Tax=unclassified Actinomyces TaxID=2609248 RepID=UPI000D58E1EA|nr:MULTISPECIES: type II toxin-antitoxin system Phd/YefM family antitoxin [unclassified Actinomyces]RAX18848.1 type II toxin-antitoxin system Phd/YefM family antitoxin [Actinomyces sp. Z3]
MPVIRPISDLRNKFTEISATVHEDDRPVFLTRNGVGDMVVMSIEHYEALALNREITEALAAAEVEMETTTERFTTADIRADLDELLAARATEQSQSA